MNCRAWVNVRSFLNTQSFLRKWNETRHAAGSFFFLCISAFYCNNTSACWYICTHTHTNALHTLTHRQWSEQNVERNFGREALNTWHEKKKIAHKLTTNCLNPGVKQEPKHTHDHIQKHVLSPHTRTHTHPHMQHPHTCTRADAGSSWESTKGLLSRC